MHDQQILPGVLKIGVVHKEEGDLRTGLGFRV
jgi:hypothetical protein